MALQAKLYRGDSLQVLDLNASHDVMAMEAVTSAAMSLWSAERSITGGISQIYTTYSFMSLLWAWQFQVIVLASALMVFTVKVYAINTRNREIASKERVSQMQKETAQKQKETAQKQKEMELASKERIARIQKETELEKMRMNLNYRLLSSQLDRNPQLDAAAALQLPVSLVGPRSLPKR